MLTYFWLINWNFSVTDSIGACKKEYHFKICLSSLSVWSQLYMEITIQSIKVVETNNFLMYMMHDAVIKSSLKARGLVTLYVCPVFIF